MKKILIKRAEIDEVIDFDVNKSVNNDNVDSTGNLNYHFFLK